MLLSLPILRLIHHLGAVIRPVPRYRLDRVRIVTLTVTMSITHRFSAVSSELQVSLCCRLSTLDSCPPPMDGEISSPWRPEDHFQILVCLGEWQSCLERSFVFTNAMSEVLCLQCTNSACLLPMLVCVFQAKGDSLGEINRLSHFKLVPDCCDRTLDPLPVQVS